MSRAGGMRTLLGRTARVLVALALAAGLVAGGCGDDEKDPTPPNVGFDGS